MDTIIITFSWHNCFSENMYLNQDYRTGHIADGRDSTSHILLTFFADDAQYSIDAVLMKGNRTVQTHDLLLISGKFS